MTGIQELLATLYGVGAYFTKDDAGQWKLRVQKGMQLTQSQKAVLSDYRTQVVEALEHDGEPVEGFFAALVYAASCAPDKQAALRELEAAGDAYELGGRMQQVYWRASRVRKRAAGDEGQEVDQGEPRVDREAA